MFRMPKGVPREIARLLLRTSSRTIPRPGQVLSYENATILYDLLSTYRKALQPAVTKAARAIERARTTPTRSKWMAALETARTKAGEADAALIALERGQGMEPLPPLSGPDVVPVVPEPTTFTGGAVRYVTPKESAVEWEIGVDYTEADGWDHRKGRASDVSFNARIQRRDGGPMVEEEVRDVIAEFAYDGVMPHGIRVRSVSWQNWKGYKRTGGAADLENFHAILQHVGDHGLRLGAVKENSL